MQKSVFAFTIFKVTLLLQAKRIYEKTGLLLGACMYMAGDKLINMFAISFVQ